MATPTNLPAAQTTGNVLTAAYVNDLRGAFRVLQVVNGSYSTEVASSSATFADTGLTATITPQSSSSKILVLVNQANVSKNGGSIYNAVSLCLVRGSTNILNFASFVGYTITDMLLIDGSVSCCYLDSPATTSATTYKTQFANSNGNIASVAVQKLSGISQAVSTITLMEISA